MARPLLLLVFLATAACPKASAPTAESSDSGVEPDEVRPVYSGQIAPNPLAKRLCDALYAAPAERLAQCCGSRAVPSLAGECTRVVSLALAGAHVSLDSQKLTGCEAALASLGTDCDRAGNPGAPLPEACEDLFSGSLAVGAVCRSALECSSGLTCVGLGPTQTGRCSAPAPADAPCHPVVDPLATFARQRMEQHRSCVGYCNRNRCADVVPVGGPCLFQDPCGDAAHCGAGKCQAGASAGLGEACTVGGCARDLACIGGKCEAQGHGGAACNQDGECLGGCRERDGGVRQCGPRCPEAFHVPVAPKPAPKPSPEAGPSAPPAPAPR